MQKTETDATKIINIIKYAIHNSPDPPYISWVPEQRQQMFSSIDVKGGGKPAGRTASRQKDIPDLPA